MESEKSSPPIPIDEIRRIVQEVVREELLAESKSVQRRLQYIALEETVEFIQKNMQHVNSVTSRYDLLTNCMSQLNTDDGLICEFGVYRGNSINHLASLTEKTIYGFDSFEGLPERWRDRFEKGKFMLEELPQVKRNVQIIQGLFQDTVPIFLEEYPDNLSLLHIDCDIYSSTKTVFEMIGDRIVPGTIIAFDDFFNYPGWKTGEFQVFNEFVETTGLKFEYIGFNRCSEQVAIRVISRKR